MFFPPKALVTAILIAIRKSCSNKAVMSCYPHRHLCVFLKLHCALSTLMQEKSFKAATISTFLFKIWSTLFSPVGDWFPWKWKWNKHSRFRFLAAPCQLRAVNAIWLTARIQNSSILKWQRERKRNVCQVISVFSWKKKKRTQFYDYLSYWLTIIGHTQLPTVPFPSNRFKCLFHSSQSFFFIFTFLLFNWSVIAFLEVHLLSWWWALNKKVVKMLKEDSYMISLICNLKRGKCW